VVGRCERREHRGQQPGQVDRRADELVPALRADDDDAKPDRGAVSKGDV
jgi:hypothetical protein